MATTDYSDWDFHNQRVQAELVGGQFISAETTLIAAGNPTLDGNVNPNITATSDTFDAYPIGLLESFGLQQNRQLQRLFEIGSSRSYFIPGRTIGSIALGRTFYYGESLLRVLYATYSDTNNNSFSSLLAGSNNEFDSQRVAGHGKLLIDLASDLFAQPTGLAVYFKDINDDTYGAFYLQEAYVQGHQMSVNSGSVLIMEGAQMQYDQLVPIKVQTGGAE